MGLRAGSYAREATLGMRHSPRRYKTPKAAAKARRRRRVEASTNRLLAAQKRSGRERLSRMRREMGY